MALTDQEIAKLREALTTCTRPMIFFDADADGLSSFLMVYKHVRDGKGIPVKNSPEVTAEYARMVDEYSPDLVVILDMPRVSQDFLDQVSTRVVWVDHHPMLDRKKVEYFNPRRDGSDKNYPTSYWIYRALQENLWVGMCGMIGDWFMPEDELRLRYIKEHPTMLPAEVTGPDVALHETRLGDMVRVIEFNMKGRTNDVIQSVKTFTRIKSPEEILDQKTAAGKFIYKKYKALNEEYQAVLEQVKVNPNDRMILMVFQDSANSFSKQLSNYLMYHHPDRLILIAWEYNGEYKCSLRSTVHNLPKVIEKALEGLSGYGGGHDRASGACVKAEHFERFVENIRKQL